MGYTYNKKYTLESNVAIAHGIAVLGAGKAIEVKTASKHNGLVQVVILPGAYVVTARGGEVELMKYAFDVNGGGGQDAAERAMQHLVDIVGPMSAQRACERAARGCLHEPQAVLFEGDDVQGGRLHLAKSFIDRKWRYVVRLGIGHSPIARANDTCAYGGCCMYPSLLAALQGYNGRAKVPASLVA